MLTLFLFFLSWQSVLVSSPAAHAEIPVALERGQFEIKGEFNYLSTTSNYPENGGTSSLYGGSLSNMQGRGQLTYDFTNQLRAFAGFSGGQTTANVVNSNLSTTGGTVTDSHVSSGLNEMWAGGQFWWHYGEFDLIPQVDFVYPFWRVDTNSNGPLLGEGAMRMQGGGWFMWSWNDFTPFGYIGYAFRDEGRSSLMPYNVGLHYTYENTWWIQGEFRGYQSVSNDANSNRRADRNVFLTRVDGGSYQYAAINPSQNEIGVQTGVQIGSLGVYVGFAATVSGITSANSFTGLGGLTFTGSFLGQKSSKLNNTFNAKSTKYDESLFQDNPAANVSPPPSPAPQVVTPPSAPPARKRTQARPARARVQANPNEPLPNVQMLMKQTEKNLENK